MNNMMQDNASSPHNPTPPEISHCRKARVIVSILMLLLAVGGGLMTELKPASNWDYWRWMVPVYAILTISLSGYIRHTIHKHLSIKTIGRDLLQWVGLFAAVYLINLMVGSGM